MSRQCFSKPWPINPMYTDATPSSSRFMCPSYNTFSQDSQNPKVDQVNNLCDYVPGKIISTHFYEQPTRKHNPSYNTSNGSPYKHANNGASRHTSIARTQPNTAHVMNSAPTRKRSCCWCFCCICLLAMSIVAHKSV